MFLQNGVSDLTSSKIPQYLATIAATLLAFSGGNAIGWSSPALHMLNAANSTLPIQPKGTEGSWISSLLTIGALIGALPAGPMADLIGRKRCLMILSIPLIASWMMIICARTISLVYAARLTAGIAVGAASTVVPVYISEIAEDSIRGTLCSAFQLMVCCGILFSYTLGAITTYYNMAVACSVVPVVFLMLFLRAPETPKYFMRSGKRDAADQSLKILRGSDYNTTKELETIENELSQEGREKKSVIESLSSRGAKLAVVISLGLMIFQQLSGVNIIIFYASGIFASAGSVIDPQICAILVGVSQLVATVLSMALIDKTGRKLLLGFSSLFMAISLAVLGFYFFLKDGGDDVSSLSLVPIIAVITYNLVFAVGFGPIPWVMSSEVLPDSIKGVFTGVASSLNWTLAFVVTFTFQGVVSSIGNAFTYWGLSFFCLLAVLFSCFVLTETKGKSGQQIQDELNGIKTINENSA